MLSGICRLIVGALLTIVLIVIGLACLPRACEVLEAALPPSVERLMVSADSTLAGQVRRLEARVEALESRLDVEESWTAYWSGR